MNLLIKLAVSSIVGWLKAKPSEMSKPKRALYFFLLIVAAHLATIGLYALAQYFGVPLPPAEVMLESLIDVIEESQ